MPVEPSVASAEVDQTPVEPAAETSQPERSQQTQQAQTSQPSQNAASSGDVLSAIRAHVAAAPPEKATSIATQPSTAAVEELAGNSDDIPVPDLDFPLDPTLFEEEEPASPRRRASLRRRSTSNLPLGPFDRAEEQDGESDEEMRDDETFLPPLPKQSQYTSQNGYHDDSSDLSDIPVEPEETEEASEPVVPVIEQALKAKPARKRKANSVSSSTVGRKRKHASVSTDIPTEPVEPWIINKKKSSYSVSTRDILNAMELEIPEHPGFTTAQEIPMSDAKGRRSRATSSLAPGATPALSEGGDIAVPDDVEEAEEERNQGINEDGEEQAEAEEEAEEEEEEEEHTIHDDPTIPLDPTLVLMKSLVQDTGRGRMSNYMIQKLESKNDKKKAMKMRRERMKMQVALERQGMAPEAIKRRLERLEAGYGSESEDEGGNEGAGQVTNEVEAQEEEQQEEEEEAEPAEDDEEERQGSQAAAEEEDREEEAADEDGFVESNYAPQVKFVDGQFVIDEEGLQIEQANVHEGYTTVESTLR